MCTEQFGSFRTQDHKWVSEHRENYSCPFCPQKSEILSHGLGLSAIGRITLKGVPTI